MRQSFNAYYYSLEATGDPKIDAILEAVARAGKMAHNTEDWTEPYWEGKSCADLIQDAANAAVPAPHVCIDCGTAQNVGPCYHVCFGCSEKGISAKRIAALKLPLHGTAEVMQAASQYNEGIDAVLALFK